MVLVRRLHTRGANIVVEAHGEVLFSAVGPVGRWTNRFSQRVKAFAAQEAPANKRPRWAHYGKPLKSTMRASTSYQPGNMRVYAAVGSSAPHAYYVDQGTGIYNGGGAYPAKVLPPWLPGSPSLYESTWRPNGPGERKVSPVMIRGQVGQKFFEKALARGFASMRMRAFQVPGDAKITDAISSAATGLAGFLGNTPPDAGFKASLAEWREWRDDAWARGEGLGRAGGLTSRYHLKYKQDIFDANEARLADKGKGVRAFRESKAAAERRLAEQKQRILEEKKRREKAEKKRRKAEEAERKRQEQEKEIRKLKAGNADMKRRAEEALRMLHQQYPDARLAATTMPDGAIIYTIRYTDASGDRQTVQWGYGYTD